MWRIHRHVPKSKTPKNRLFVPGICKICRFLTEILVKTHVLPNSSLSSFFNRYPRSHRLKPHVYICFHISLHISLHMFTSLNIDKMGYHGVSWGIPMHSPSQVFHGTHLTGLAGIAVLLLNFMAFLALRRPRIWTWKHMETLETHGKP